jgi:hypothetical protein
MVSGMTPGVTCAQCGQALADTATGAEHGRASAANAGAAAVAAGWLREVGARGRVSWVCPVCVRRHLRSIEARLDDDLW